MLNFFKLLLVIFLWFFSFINLTHSNSNKTFIISAYCSPWANDSAAYKRLNWNGTHTASWKAVFRWIVAAPKSYPFWTKIYLEWYWVVVVEDRWWAIVKAWVRWHEHDRLDVWMWYWEACKNRAIKWWWKKTVKWKIISKNSKVSIKFSSKWLLKQWYKKISFKKSTKEVAIILKYWAIKVNQDKPNVKEVIKLQKLFKELQLYNWPINWKYKDIEKDLIAFQQKVKLIRRKTDWGAWHFWEKTRSAMISYFELDKNKLKKKKSVKIDKVKNKEDKIKEKKKTIKKDIKSNETNKKDTYILKLKDIRNLKKISKKLNIIIKKKADGDDKKLKEIKKILKSKIIKMHTKTINISLKAKLNYLLNNL